MQTAQDALAALESAWPYIVSECRAVLGSELHYQAIIYHCLRTYGNIPLKQLGMNVKMWVAKPKTRLFQQLDLKKHEDFRGGFEPIPDVVLFRPAINGDWRRRNSENTNQQILAAIEVKASERANGRLHSKELIDDILKLSAQRQEVRFLGADLPLPVLMIIDTAPLKTEQLSRNGLEAVLEAGIKHHVAIYYLSSEQEVIQRITPRMQPAYPHCIYHIKRSQELSEIYAGGGSTTLLENRRWQKALDYLQDAREHQQELLLFFDHAEEFQGVSWVASIENIAIHQLSENKYQSRIDIRDLKPIPEEQRFQISKLIKASDGTFVDSKYQHGYLPCITPGNF